MPILGEIGSVSKTRSGGAKSSMQWRILDFLSLEGEKGDSYTSPFFNCCSGIWYLSIYPQGLQRIPSSDCVSLSLARFDSGEGITINATIGIQEVEGVQNKSERWKEFSDQDEKCFWSGLCSRKQLEENKSRLMPSNVLTITVDMRRVTPKAERNTTTQTERKEVATEENNSPEKQDASTQTENSEVDEFSFEGRQSSGKQGGEKALEDFSKLLSSGENSDVTIKLGDVEFKVHSFILFARCPALSISLQHDSKEKASRMITIEDCKPDAFRDFLHYLYTGSVPSLSEQSVFALYCIADKYLAEEVKQHCLEHIIDTLSVQTFCNSIKLAVTYGESGLLQKAIDFATKNIRSIVCTVEWQDFICKYPIEANEIFIKSLGPPSS